MTETIYALPEPYDGIYENGKIISVFHPEQMQAAFDAGRASRDSEVEALRADKQVLLSHMDTFMRVSNDPAIYNLAKVVTERFAAQE